METFSYFSLFSVYGTTLWAGVYVARIETCQSRFKSSRACVYAFAGYLIGLLLTSILILLGSRSTIQGTKALQTTLRSVRKLEERQFGLGQGFD
jgi:hypothetical protein